MDIKKILKFALKSAIFSIIALLIVLILTPIFTPKWYDKYGGVSRRTRGIYTEPEDTIDVVIMGNSDVYYAVVPMELWNDLGVTSYHIGCPRQTTWISYYLLRDFYKRQNPKLAIINVEYIFEKENKNKNLVEQVLVNMPWSKNKIDLINCDALDLSLKFKLRYWFPLISYHSRWKAIDAEEIESTYAHYTTPFKGYEFTKKVKPYKKTDNKIEKVTEIPENSKKYLEKVIEECNNHGTEVLLIYVPTAKCWTKEKSDLAREFAKEHNLQYVDYNTEDFNWEKYTKDGGEHLNVYGGQDITKKLEKILKDYDLPNHKDDELYNDWNENYELYESLL